MKIIYIANIRIPTEKAHGLQIMKMCEAFIHNKVDVELIAPWRFNLIKENPFRYFGLKNNFKIKKLPSLDLIPLGLPKVGFWIQSYSFAFFSFFYLIFKKKDIIYSRDLSCLWFLSFFNKSIIYEAHTLPKNLFLYRQILKKAKIVVTTKKLKESFIKKAINPEKIIVACDGVDLDKFDIKITKEEAQKKMGLPTDKKIVLYAGHLYRWKGVHTLIKASKNLDHDYLVVFIGGTRKKIVEFKKKNIKSRNILFIGHRAYREIPLWLKAANVLILPNSAEEKISRYWTSPLKMFEYMSSKRPIVASNLPSIREVLNENNAILVQSDNPKALAAGIKKSLKDHDFSDYISKQAFKDVNNYTWHKRASKIMKFIKNDINTN